MSFVKKKLFFIKVILFCFSINFLNIVGQNNNNGSNNGVLDSQEKDSDLLALYKTENEDNDINLTKKMKEIQQLTENAAKYFNSVTLEKACNDFMRDPVWRKGELFVFVIRVKDAICLAHGDDDYLIWKSWSKLKSNEGKPLIQEMAFLKKGGKVGFTWDNGFKFCHVKPVIKNGETYILGSGFFPESDEFTSKEIVISASEHYFRHGKDETFSLISNPRGPFVKGYIYAEVFDFEGNCYANGKNLAFVGQNLIDFKDVDGKFIVQEMINLLKNKSSGWVSYKWQGELKKTFVKKIEDKKDKKNYIIAAGYYPNTTLSAVERFVNKAAAYLKASGSQKAFAQFSNPVGDFVQGGMAINVYDYKGKSLADGNNPGFVGQNLINLTDPTGKFILREIIKTAKNYGQGIVSYIHNNSFTLAIVKAIEVPDGKFIITSKFYPDVKSQSTKALVEQAVEYLNTHPAENAFSEFSSRTSRFMRGDLSIFVYKEDGTLLVNGKDKRRLWKNYSKVTDQSGNAVIENLISTAVNGGGWIKYNIRNAQRRVYVKALTKENARTGKSETFIIGSGYFL